jgi:hypothetical protein
MSCIPVDRYRCFGGKSCLHLQWFHFPEDRNFGIYLHDNLRYYTSTYLGFEAVQSGSINIFEEPSAFVLISVAGCNFNIHCHEDLGSRTIHQDYDNLGCDAVWPGRKVPSFQEKHGASIFSSIRECGDVAVNPMSGPKLSDVLVNPHVSYLLLFHCVEL